MGMGGPMGGQPNFSQMGSYPPNMPPFMANMQNHFRFAFLLLL